MGYVTVRIIDRHGHDRPVGETGEIAVVGSNLPPGYWKDPDLTKTKYRILPGGDHQRMCLTGDMGSVDADGLLYLQGRKDAQLKIRGYRVDLGEIDAVLNSIEGVALAVVIEAESETWGKRLTAFVSFSGEPALNPKALRRKAAARLPGYMVPEKILVVDEIPFTSRGKVDKKALVSMALNL